MLSLENQSLLGLKFFLRNQTFTAVALVVQGHAGPTTINGFQVTRGIPNSECLAISPYARQVKTSGAPLAISNRDIRISGHPLVISHSEVKVSEEDRLAARATGWLAPSYPCRAPYSTPSLAG